MAREVARGEIWFTVRKSELRHYVGSLTGEKMREVCHALNIACGCD